MLKAYKYFKRAPKFHRFAFWITLISSIGLIVGGFFVPPMGIIDGSILTAVGELLGFSSIATLIHAIESGLDAKFTHNNTTVEINNDSNKPEEEE